MPCANNTSQDVATLLAMIDPAVTQDLPELSPSGHELASKLLKPPDDRHEPLMHGKQIAAIKKPDMDRIDKLMHNKVRLLGGKEGNLGDPIDWFFAPEGDFAVDNASITSRLAHAPMPCLYSHR